MPTISLFSSAPLDEDVCKFSWNTDRSFPLLSGRFISRTTGHGGWITSGEIYLRIEKSRVLIGKLSGDGGNESINKLRH